MPLEITDPRTPHEWATCQKACAALVAALTKAECEMVMRWLHEASGTSFTDLEPELARQAFRRWPDEE